MSRRGAIRLLLMGAASTFVGRTGVLFAARSAVRITRSEPTVAYTEFDPDNLPADMPPLGQATALCVETHSVEASMNYAMGWVTRKKAPVVVKGITAITHLDLHIYTPIGDALALEHEEGHRAIAEHYYQDAAAVARELGEQFIDRRFEGAGETRDAALRNAEEAMITAYTDAYLARAEARSTPANERFDEIMEDDVIGAREAVELSIASVP